MAFLYRNSDQNVEIRLVLHVWATFTPCQGSRYAHPMQARRERARLSESRTPAHHFVSQRKQYGCIGQAAGLQRVNRFGSQRLRVGD